MTPVSIRNRTSSQSAAIQRSFRAAKMRKLFDDIEAQLTDPVLIEMTRFMRDTVMGAPEFAKPPAEGYLKAHVDACRALVDLPYDEFVKATGPYLSNDAAVVFESILELGGEDIWIPYADIGQKLLDAGLVAQSTDEDGRVTYRLTAAGKAWRAAS